MKCARRASGRPCAASAPECPGSCFRNEVERFADLLGDQVGLAIGVEDLGQVLGVGDGVRPADHSMVGEQDGVVVLDKGSTVSAKAWVPGSHRGTAAGR